MNDNNPSIRNISDTALWAAAFRALESERADAVFRDPLARMLAGDRGMKAVREMPSGTKHSWAWVTRTWSFDRLIDRAIREGADAVINLAAGLDARPYRMDLPPALKWVEVDLPELLTYKEEVLKSETARCRLERVAMDLSNMAARRALFERVGREAKKAVVITEGLLIYLSREEVAALAGDLAAMPGMRHWVTDVCSPGLLRILQKNIGDPLREAGAPLKFGPEEGIGFFEPLGWRAAEVMSTIRTGAKIKRSPLFLRLIALLPEPKGKLGSRPWSGACLLERDK